MNERFLKILDDRPSTFADFHALACKSMPDVTRYPEQYNLCYELMELAWRAALQSRYQK